MRKKLIISSSSINTFYKNKSTYINKYLNKSSSNNTPKSKSLIFGTSIHSTLNDFNLLPLKKQTKNSLQKLLNKNWITEGYNSNEEMLSEFVRARNMLDNYFDERKDIGKLLLSEQMIFYNVNSNLSICGKIDKVFINSDGKIELLDYKTGLHTNLMIDPTTDIQLPLYIILLKHKLNIIPNVISYYYLSTNNKISLNISNDIINDSLERLKSIINDMNTQIKL
ncbi:RecB family exonuclease [Clostridium baratii]|uniref:PD-(D/E)XK endonuclease-like domain-containing protein n=2 Tax=Clostridium TaxID=1485 RepID=A0ABN1LTP6_9CLOT